MKVTDSNSEKCMNHARHSNSFMTGVVPCNEIIYCLYTIRPGYQFTTQRPHFLQ
mgnify:CR=1 FL=1